MRIARLLVTNVAAGNRVRLKVKLPARVRKLILAALAKRRGVTLSLAGAASVRGMTSGSATAVIHLLI